MKIEAKIKEVEVPIDENTAKYAYEVHYCVFGGQIVHYWTFYNIYADKCIAEYVKKGIEERKINVIYHG